MVDILVRNVDDAGAAEGRSQGGGQVGQRNRPGAFRAYVKPSKAEAWAAIDAIRKKIGRVSVDSTETIRNDRDNR